MRAFDSTGTQVAVFLSDDEMREIWMDEPTDMSDYTSQSNDFVPFCELLPVIEFPRPDLISFGPVTRSLEGPTVACDDCGRLIHPRHAYNGKVTGTQLCPVCLRKWIKAGRAKRGGEF